MEGAKETGSGGGSSKRQVVEEETGSRGGNLKRHVVEGAEEMGQKKRVVEGAEETGM